MKDEYKMSKELEMAVSLGANISATKILICHSLYFNSEDEYTKQDIDKLAEIIHDLFLKFDEIDIFTLIDGVINKNLYPEDLEDLNKYEKYDKILGD